MNNGIFDEIPLSINLESWDPFGVFPSVAV